MSKSSFWINERWNFKTRHASIILNFMVWFVMLTVVTLVSQILLKDAKTYNMAEYSAQVIYGQTIMAVIMNLVIAVGMAIEAFGWMNNISQVDMYKSVPVKESARFAYINLNSFIIYIGGFLVNLLLEIVLLAVNNSMRGNVCIYLIYLLAISVASFVSSYAISLIAVFLTGNGVLAFMGGMFLNLVEMILLLMWNLAKMLFYSGYDVSDLATENYIGLFTPVCMAANSIGHLSEERMVGYLKATFTTRMIWVDLLIILIQAVVYMALAYGLYKRRYANVAGRRIVFEMAKPVIEIAILTVAGFAAGIMMEILNGRQVAIIVIIITVVIIHVILLMIMDSKIHFDVKGIVSLVLGAGLAVLLFVYPAYDLGGFKSYVPDVSEIEGYSVIFNYDSSESYYNLADDHIEDVQSEVYLLDSVMVTDKETIKAFTDIVSEAVKNDDGKDNLYENVRVKYHLTNGRTKYREYHMSEALYEKAFKVTYDNMQYRQGINALEYNRNIVEKFANEDGVSWNSAIGYYSIKKDGKHETYEKEVYEKLYEALSADMMDRSAEQVLTTVPLGRIDLNMNINEGPYRGNYVYLSEPIYSFDKRTMAIIADLHWDELPEPDYSQITRVEIDKNHFYMEDDYEYSDQLDSVVFDDPEDIKKIVEAAYSDEVNLDENCRFYLDYNYTGTIVTDENGGVYTGIYFGKDNVPQFVLDAFDKSTKQ